MSLSLDIPTIQTHRAWRFLVPLATVTGMAVLAAIMAHLLLLMPVREQQARVAQAYDQSRQKQHDLVQTRARHERVRRAHQEVARIQRDLPAIDEFTALAVGMAEMARAEQLKIPGMTESIGTSQTGLPTQASLSFHAIGPYPSIYRFLHRVESSDAYLFVESLEVTRTEDSQRLRPNVVGITVKVTTFLRPSTVSDASP